MEHVTIEDPPRMNLLGLMLAHILERNLAHPRLKQRAARLSGEVAVQAGQMAVTLSFERGAVTVRRGAVERPRAAVRGSMADLLGLALGGGMVGPWLAGRLKTRGSLLLLLRLKPLLAADPPPAP